MRFYRTSDNYALTGPVNGAVGLADCGAGVPVAPTPVNAAMTECQAQAFVEALKPRCSGKPVVAVLALNEGTETTDFLLPHAVLQRAGVADVQVVAPRRGRVFLYPALQVEVAQDLASFDRAYPSGADYVVVPAMRDDNNPAIAAWLKLGDIARAENWRNPEGVSSSGGISRRRSSVTAPFLGCSFVPPPISAPHSSRVTCVGISTVSQAKRSDGRRQRPFPEADDAIKSVTCKS